MCYKYISISILQPPILYLTAVSPLQNFFSSPGINSHTVLSWLLEELNSSANLHLGPLPWIHHVIIFCVFTYILAKLSSYVTFSNSFHCIPLSAPVQTCKKEYFRNISVWSVCTNRNGAILIYVAVLS